MLSFFVCIWLTVGNIKACCLVVILLISLLQLDGTSSEHKVCLLDNSLPKYCKLLFFVLFLLERQGIEYKITIEEQIGQVRIGGLHEKGTEKKSKKCFDI